MHADLSSYCLSWRRLTILKRFAPHASAALLSLWPALVGALGLGVPQLDSRLGQVLDLSIQIRTEANEDFDPQCIRLVNPVDDQIPTLTAGRIRVDLDGALLWVRIQSLTPISEPALRLVVELGCTQRVRREYVLLIDPPAPGRGDASAQRTLAPSRPDADRPVPALAFGEPRIQAVQGHRLALSAPLIGADASSLTPACLRLVNDDIQPAVYADASLRLVGAGGPQPAMEIFSRVAVTDRMLRIVVEAGCGPTIRREFNILVEAAPILSGPVPGNSQMVANPPSRSGTRSRQPTGPQLSTPGAAQRSLATTRPAAAAPVAASVDGHQAGKRQTSRGGPDRLVLADPDTPKVAIVSRPAAIPDASSELVKRLDELSSEVKRLQGELQAANERNTAMVGRLGQDRSWTFGGWIVGFITLAFGAWALLVWRRRSTEPEDEDPFEGPLTRIIGKPTVESSAAQPAVAGTAMGSVLIGAHLSEMRPELHVTEIADEEAIRALYADVVRGNTISTPLRVANVDIPLDLPTGDKAINGSVEVNGNGSERMVARGDLRPTSDDSFGASPQRTLGDAWDEHSLPESQMPTTVLKPLELDLDLSDFTQRNDKRAGS